MLLNVLFPLSLFLDDLPMLLCGLSWVSQETESEIEMSMKEIYWEFLFSKFPFERERERGEQDWAEEELTSWGALELDGLAELP